MLSDFVARAAGIGPALAGLESAVLPLYEARMALTIIANPAQGGAYYLVSL